MKKMSFIIMFLLCLVSVEMVHSAKIQEDLRGNIIRMHIIANSNSELDQEIKLKIRDEIIGDGYIDPQTAEKKANEILKAERAGYTATAGYETTYVPVKEYKNIALPEGIYDCLNVTLGEGKGENWWCIAYPPLCFTESVVGDLSEEAKEKLQGRLSKETLETIIKNGDVSFKFKTVEECQKLIKLIQKCGN